jgi:RNA:NAD 2'-phosphotransferase (TPT1/KptA family)
MEDDIKVRKLYHCTLKNNMDSIQDEGINRSCDGVVYLADSADNSAKFLVIRGFSPENLVSFEVDVDELDRSKLDYSYDHNEAFFGCKAYVYADDISAGALIDMYEFE